MATSQLMPISCGGGRIKLARLSSLGIFPKIGGGRMRCQLEVENIEENIFYLLMGGLNPILKSEVESHIERCERCRLLQGRAKLALNGFVSRVRLDQRWISAVEGTNVPSR